MRENIVFSLKIWFFHIGLSHFRTLHGKNVVGLAKISGDYPKNAKRACFLQNITKKHEKISFLMKRLSEKWRIFQDNLS